MTSPFYGTTEPSLTVNPELSRSELFIDLHERIDQIIGALYVLANHLHSECSTFDESAVMAVGRQVNDLETILQHIRNMDHKMVEGRAAA